MSKRYFIAFFFLFCLFAADYAEAQRRRPTRFRGRRASYSVNKRYWSLGLNVNALNYFGDLAPKSQIASTKISFTRPGFGATAMYRIGPQASLRGSFMWGRLRGDDISADKNDTDEAYYRYVRNQHFRNDIKELGIDFVLDLKSHYRTFISRPEWVPYIFVGIAGFYHNPRAMVPDLDYVNFDGQPITEAEYGAAPGEWVELRPLGTEGQYIPGSGVDTYSKIQIAIPAGVGIRYKLNRYWDLSFEFGYRQTFTDYLDDVSADYVDLDAFDQGSANPNLARVMSYRSNEPIAAVTGEQRDIPFIVDRQGQYTYGDRNYTVFNGYGDDSKDAIRGKDDYDVYLVSRFTITYILGTTVRNAKFR